MDASRHIALLVCIPFQFRPRPFVYRVDLAPYSVIALHHSRREREALINVEALEYHSVVLDGSKVTLEDLAPDKDAPDDLIARWRSGCEQSYSVEQRDRLGGSSGSSGQPTVADTRFKADQDAGGLKLIRLLQGRRMPRHLPRISSNAVSVAPRI